ncbi:Tetraacyldisaccharide 4'-kinase [Vibrio stylophorae]|uniref:Tetraacyldisaccharide 4'-kinase n=1 Tax=Vibrio stylophorae TaxID=659351 RepID=A0ABM8ZTW4_9VIBR|nr:tetraacyldisaccharide 4'-kinase [Vibrio stylophorae]CAH0533760.1 Tetraacyldisaccharide 4'-kinase [Vibrio stylophorae]
MIEKLWFQSHWLGIVLWPLLRPLSALYGWIVRKKRRTFLEHPEQSYRAPCPVIVVGNLTAGGNGKTPVVIWLVEALQQQGLSVGVVSRGYGGKAPHYPYLVDAQTATAIAGDEPVLIAKRTGASVAVAPKRSQAIEAILAQQPVDVIITDDGLQHYAMARDIELVVVDGMRRFGNGHYMPQGPMRESEARLSSVDYVICNGGQAMPGEYAMQLAPQAMINVKTGERVTIANFLAQHRQAVAMAGIGHPPRFFNTLKQLGFSLLSCHPFVDHQSVSPETLNGLVDEQTPLLMTEKDAVKYQECSQANWWYLAVDAQFEQSMAPLLAHVMHCKEEYGSSSI